MRETDDRSAWLQRLDPEVRAFVQTLLQLPDGALHLARYAAILREKARERATMAEIVALGARENASAHAEVLELTQWAVRAHVPAWHFRLVRDEARNATYQRALELNVGAHTLVFEVGTGTGILAMMAARTGAEHVYTCEASPVIAKAAAENIRRNGLADRVTVIPKPAADVMVGRDLPRRADLFVSELVDNHLLGEHVLPIIEDVKRRVLHAEARLLPATIMLRGALVGDGHWISTARMARAAGLDLSAFNALAPRRAAVDDVDRVVAGELAGALSDDFTVIEFNLQNETKWPAGHRRAVVTSRRAGRADALLTWLRLDFGGGVGFENRPPQKSCWTPIVYPLGDGIDVREDQTVVLDIRHDRREIRIRVDQTG